MERSRIRSPAAADQSSSAGDGQTGASDRPGSLGQQPTIGIQATSRAGGSSSVRRDDWRSEEHTSELQSLMRISYAVFCLKKKSNIAQPTKTTQHINATTQSYS